MDISCIPAFSLLIAVEDVFPSAVMPLRTVRLAALMLFFALPVPSIMAVEAMLSLAFA